MQNEVQQEFLQFYKPIHSRFIKYCSSMAYGKMETQDLVQETVFITIQKWERIQKKESLLAFMVGTASRILQNHYRKTRREIRMESEQEALSKMEAKTQSPDLAYDIHLLHQAMDQLNIKEKECLILYEISGFSIREVAAIQNETESAIKSRLSRSRQKLHSMLEEKPIKINLSSERPSAALFSILALL